MKLGRKMELSIVAAVIVIMASLRAIGSMPELTTLDLGDLSSCPCSNKKWCEPIKGKREKEQFAFSVKNNESYWRFYDWDKLTTIATADYFNMSLVCLAHSHNTRVIFMSQVDEKTFMNPDSRRLWIDAQLKTIKDNRLDGINFDYEGAIGSTEESKREAYTALVRETRQQLLKQFPDALVAVDVGWRPNVDERYYDYPGLAQNSDFLVLMAYDEQSQIYGECLAGPNCPYNATLYGVKEYLSKYGSKIKASQLILAVPWFGITYECIQTSKDKCYIKKMPYRGAPCSDSPGIPHDYKDIEKLNHEMPDKYRWNETSYTPYIMFKNDTTGITYQIQFDDIFSLKLKYDIVTNLSLRGAGIFTIDMLDYSDTPEGSEMRAQMFGALPPTKSHTLLKSESATDLGQRPVCPCSDQKLCEPITDTTRREVVAFSVHNDPSHWQFFDWSRLTTVVMFNYVSTDLMCLAHSHGVRVVMSGSVDKKTIFSESLRSQWVEDKLQTVYNNFLDGINFDFEEPCSPSQKSLRNSYTALVNETSHAFRKLMPYTQISVDVIDTASSNYRHYNYQGLAKAADFLFIMAYDESVNGQVGPNSDYWTANWAIKSYQTDSIHPNKLVLGLPWYGDVYQCTRLEGDTCETSVTAVGIQVSQVCYCGIMQTLSIMPDHYKWNASSKTPYFSYQNTHAYQVQYDDPKSLGLKYKLAVHAGIRGVGIWHLDCLDFSDNEQAKQQREAMFSILPNYKSDDSKQQDERDTLLRFVRERRKRTKRGTDFS